MHVDPQFLWRLAAAITLGLVVAMFTGLLQRFGPVRHMRVAALLAAFATGAWIVVRGSALYGQDVLLPALATLAILAAADALLQAIDIVVWNWFFALRRKVAVPRLLVDVFNLLAMAAVVLVVLKYVFGMALGGLLVTSTVLSAIIGLALQDMLGNIVAGLALQLERPFSVGDWVFVAAHEGVVTQLNWRTLTLRTRDNHEVIVPNAAVAKAEIVNYSRPTALERLHVSVGVAYRHAPGTVKAALVRAASAADGVVSRPPVDVLLREFADFSITYDVRFWIDDFARAQEVADDVRSRIWYELRRADLTIPMPTREVTMRTVADDEEARASAQRRSSVWEVVRPLAMFAPLSDAQVDILVAGATLQLYAAGETLVRQGDPGSSLFVVKSGFLRVEKAHPDAPPTRLGSFEPGDIFGEMSLLTGEPRSASVIAEAETQVVVVDKEAMAAVLDSDNSVLEAMSTALEARLRNSAALYSAAETTALPTKAPPQRAVLLRHIRRFFGFEEGT